MKLKVNLPCVFIVRDYHEFREIEQYLRQVLGDDVHVEEIGCAFDYHGIAYYKEKDKKYRKVEEEVLEILHHHTRYIG